MIRELLLGRVPWNEAKTGENLHRRFSSVNALKRVFRLLILSLSPLSPGEGDAQAAAPLPQCYLSLLCWQPAAVGTNSKTIQC